MTEERSLFDLGVRPAECLEGLDLDEGWHVESIINKHPKSTGGCFSVSYTVSHKTGHHAFLKALDFSSAFQWQGDQAMLLESMTAAFNFERKLLSQCAGLSRVVTALANGYADIKRHRPFNRVPYLIFDLAQGNIRTETSEWTDFDVAWALRSLHNSTVGLQQLHQKRIAHQDLKPSNILVFKDEGSKLCDLGRASSATLPSQNDNGGLAGDWSYAAPEQYYGWAHVSGFEHRYISDIYSLGGLLFFFFIGVSPSQLMWKIIDELNHPHSMSKCNR